MFTRFRVRDFPNPARPVTTGGMEVEDTMIISTGHTPMAMWWIVRGNGDLTSLRPGNTSKRSMVSSGVRSNIILRALKRANVLP